MHLAKMQFCRLFRKPLPSIKRLTRPSNRHPVRSYSRILKKRWWTWRLSPEEERQRLAVGYLQPNHQRHHQQPEGHLLWGRQYGAYGVFGGGQMGWTGGHDHPYFRVGKAVGCYLGANTMMFKKSHGGHKAPGRAALWSAAERYGMRWICEQTVHRVIPLQRGSVRRSCGSRSDEQNRQKRASVSAWHRRPLNRCT